MPKILVQLNGNTSFRENLSYINENERYFKRDYISEYF